MTYKLNGVELTDKQVQEIVEYAKRKKEFIEEGKEYWYLNNRCCGRNIWRDDIVDNDRLDRDNVFLTEEAVIKADNKRLALGRIRKYIRENGLNYEPDWGNNDSKYQITGWNDLNNYVFTIALVETNCSQHNLVFKSLEDMQKVLDNCKEDLEILLK